MKPVDELRLALRALLTAHEDLLNSDYKTPSNPYPSNWCPCVLEARRVLALPWEEYRSERSGEGVDFEQPAVLVPDVNSPMYPGNCHDGFPPLLIEDSEAGPEPFPLDPDSERFGNV